MALITYSNVARVRFDFSQSYDGPTIENAIITQTYMNGGTATASALSLADTLLSSSDSGYDGGKAVVIVVTDGVSQETGTVLTMAINNLQAAAEVFVVGVGSQVSVPELNQIASAPSSSHVFLLDFVQLNSSVDVLSQIAVSSACPPVSSTSTTTASTPTTTTSTFSSTSTIASICNNFEPIDFIFVLDSSASLGLDNWDLTLQFAVDFVNAIPVSATTSRIALVTFASTALIRFDFSKSYDKSAIETAIYSQPYQNTGTATASALNLAEMLLSSEDSGYRGGKAVVILVTDGQSQESGIALADSIAGVKALAEVFVVGLGQNISVPEVESIASDPVATHKFLLDYSQFNDSMNAIITDIAVTSGCQSNTTTTVTATTTTQVTSTTTTLPYPICVQNGSQFVIQGTNVLCACSGNCQKVRYVD